MENASSEMKELDCTGGEGALQEGLAGYGETILARENFGDSHVWHNSRKLTQDIQQGRLFARRS
jgi:hypothetical protein